VFQVVSVIDCERKWNAKKEKDKCKQLAKAGDIITKLWSITTWQALLMCFTRVKLI